MLTRSQLSDVAGGLSYLHTCAVIHGDLNGVRAYFRSSLILPPTPRQSNILVDTTGRARITDFGLATIAHILDVVQGTPAEHVYAAQWAAPEILNGQGSYSVEADVFSFAGVTIEVSFSTPLIETPQTIIYVN